ARFVPRGATRAFVAPALRATVLLGRTRRARQETTDRRAPRGGRATAQARAGQHGAEAPRALPRRAWRAAALHHRRAERVAAARLRDGRRRYRPGARAPSRATSAR